MFVLRKVGSRYKVYYGSVRMNGAVVCMDKVEDFMGTLAQCEKYIEGAIALDKEMAVKALEVA